MAVSRVACGAVVLVVVSLAILASEVHRCVTTTCAEVENIAFYNAGIALNRRLPSPLRVGYLKPVWPKWVPTGPSSCSLAPSNWQRGTKFSPVAKLLSFEALRLGRNISVYELGCGSCKICCRLNLVPGVRCVGVDIANSDAPNYMKWDLATFLPLTNVDYVLTFESAEHIPPEFEENYLSTMVQAKVGMIVSWASPGQGGMGHYNEHSQDYVTQKIQAMSKHVFCARRTNDMRKDLYVGKLLHAYRKMNIMVFLHSEGGDVDVEEVCSDGLSAESQSLIWSGVAVVSCLLAMFKIFMVDFKLRLRSLFLALCIVSLLFMLDGLLVLD